MSSIGYISDVARKLTRKYKTLNPYEICDALGICIRHKDLGTDIKAYYFYQSRIRNIVLNSRVTENIRRILVAHELGHDRLHKDIPATMKAGFSLQENRFVYQPRIIDIPQLLSALMKQER